MKYPCSFFLGFLLLFSSCFAQTEAYPFAHALGLLGFPFGTYHTIEGLRKPPSLSEGTRIFVVETVDGKKLAKPVNLWIENIADPGLPENELIVLKGYESGRFTGSPALPKEEEEKWPSSQIGFAFRSFFILTTIVRPSTLLFERPPPKN